MVSPLPAFGYSYAFSFVHANYFQRYSPAFIDADLYLCVLRGFCSVKDQFRCVSVAFNRPAYNHASLCLKAEVSLGGCLVAGIHGHRSKPFELDTIGLRDLDGSSVLRDICGSFPSSAYDMERPFNDL